MSDTNNPYVPTHLIATINKAPVRMKVCVACRRRIGAPRRLPATTEHFYRDRHQDDGLTTQCKDCRRDTVMTSRHRHTMPSRIPRRVLELGNAPPGILIEIPLGYKRCTNPYCGRIRPASKEYFYPTPSSPATKSKGGLESHCKRCANHTRTFDRDHAVSPEEQDPNSELVDSLVDGQDIPAELLDELESGGGV